MMLFGLSFPTISQPARLGFMPFTAALVLSLSGSALVYLYVFTPAHDRLARLETAYQTAKQTQAKLEAARKAQEQVRSAKEELNKVWQVLPTQNEFTSLAVAIAELGRTEKVAIPGMTYSLLKSDEGLPAKATISFKATGEYAAIYRFIHRLESTDPYLVIESLDAAREAKSERTALTFVVFNIRVTTFLRPNPPSTGMS